MKMKMIFGLVGVAAALSFFGASGDADGATTYSLTVKVEGLRNSTGVVQFAVYNKDGSIPDEKFKKYFKKQTAKIVNGASSVTFKDLPQGRYAVNILHDENKNGKIDKRFIKPIEGIGFSNYTSIGLANRPNFNGASFELVSDAVKTVNVIYL